MRLGPVSWLASLLACCDQPVWLAGGVILPIIIVALLARRDRDRRRRLARLGDPATVRRLLPASTVVASRWRGVLLGSAALCIGVAFAGPRWGAERASIRMAGADVAVAIDASLSMLARDERPNRLERAKEDVRRLRALSPGDRTALLAFAGRSYIMTPLTIDDGALALFLDNLDPSVVGQPGTSLSRTIRQGTDLLLATPTASDRALVVLSDGEAFESDVEVRAAAARAAENGISLVAVGYGTTHGASIPIANGSGTTLKRDDTGAVVVTHYTPDLLRAAAEAAHGTFIPATTTDKAANIRRALSKLRVVRRAVEAGEDRSPRFQLFLLPALVLLAIDTLLADPRRSRRSAAIAPAGPSGVRAAAGMVAALLVPNPFGHAHLPASGPPHATGAAASRAAVYRRAIDAGDRSPRMLYNYGTALLAADSDESAIAALTRAADARDAEVRYRAWFNLGLAHLQRGLARPGDSGASELQAALDAYKRVLLTRPGDTDARWNYELALRKRHEGGGGGGGGAGGGGPGGRAPSPPPGPARDGGASAAPLGQRQAGELLNSAAREERDVEGRVQRQSPPETPPGGHDW